MFDKTQNLFDAIVSLSPIAPATKAKVRRDAIKAAGGAEYEARLEYERAARAAFRARHPHRNAELAAAHRKRLGVKSNRYSSSFRAELCSRVRKRGRKRGMEATITPADLVWPSHCPVLGIELDYPERSGQRGLQHVQPNWPSLDRWDSTKGYVPGNVFVISCRANTLKSSATYEEVLKVAKYLAKRPR